MPQAAIGDPAATVLAASGVRSADTDSQIERAILETQALAGVFSRLGHEARPSFGWRCAGMSDAIRAALTHYFEEAVS